MPDAASDARRSSAIVRAAPWNGCCNSLRYAEPLSGRGRKVAPGQVEVFEGHLARDAVHLGACRAPDDTEVSVFAPCALAATAARKASWFPASSRPAAGIRSAWHC